MFAVNGFCFASWASRVPDVKHLLSLSPGKLGIMLLAISVGSLVGLPVAGRVAHRLGAARTVQLGALVSMPGFIVAALAVQARASLVFVMLGLLLVGLGNGVWDVAQNLEGTIVEQALNRAIMPWFHAAFSGGTVLAALVGALLVWLHVPIGWHVCVVSVLGGVAVWWGSAAFLPAFDENTGEAAAAKHPARSPWTEPRTLLIGVMVLAAAFAEGTANDWIAVAFVDGHGVSNAAGVLALAVFLTFMTAGRILGTSLLDRHGRVPVLRLLFTAAVLGCVLVVFGNVQLAYLGAAVWGIGASLGFPVGMSAAADEPERAAMRLSVVSTIGYGAFLGGPPLLGFLGNHVGVLDSLLAVGAVSVLAMAIVPVAKQPAPAQAR